MSTDDPRSLMEALRGEHLPEGWDFASAGAYTRELWAPDAETAHRISRQLALVDSVRGEDPPSVAEMAAAYDQLVDTPSNVVVERALRRRAETQRDCHGDTILGLVMAIKRHDETLERIRVATACDAVTDIVEVVEEWGRESDRFIASFNAIQKERDELRAALGKAPQ